MFTCSNKTFKNAFLMNSPLKRIIGIDEDWNELLSLGIIEEGESTDGFTLVTDGERWGLMGRNPMIPIKYDSIYICGGEDNFLFVCETDGRFDTFDDCGKPESIGLTNYDVRDFDIASRSFICLANSYKRGGRCIAGVEVDSNSDIKYPFLTYIRYNKNGSPKWIRPIAGTQYGEIPNHIANNINLLSLVTLANGSGRPQNPHRENMSYGWIKVRSLPFSADSSLLNKFVDKVHQSIFGNRGKAISVDMAHVLDYSLMFIHVQNACAYIDENREKSKNRMKFNYYGTEYDFPITDPAFLDEFRKEPERFAIIPEVYLTLSLGLEFEGWHHKLVAGVIIPTCSSHTNDTEDVSYMEQQKRLHTNAYAKWTTEEDEQLNYLYTEEGVSISDLSQIFGRNEGAIRSRIRKLGLDDEISVSQYEQSNWFDEYERKFARLLEQKADIEEQINELRQKLLKQMENHGVHNVNSRKFSVSYTPAKTVMQFDSKAFRAENEELYSYYCKPKQRDASIVVKRIKFEDES